MINTWTAFPAGVVIASTSTSLGIGGGMLWMPFFLIILKMRPETAVIVLPIFGLNRLILI
jgi:uncharacterized membrane protein YfcA